MRWCEDHNGKIFYSRWQYIYHPSCTKPSCDLPPPRRAHIATFQGCKGSLGFLDPLLHYLVSEKISDVRDGTFLHLTSHSHHSALVNSTTTLLLLSLLTNGNDQRREYAEGKIFAPSASFVERADPISLGISPRACTILSKLLLPPPPPHPHQSSHMSSKETAPPSTLLPGRHHTPPSVE